MKKCIINYANLRDAELLTFARAVYQSMNGNANFPAPDPGMPEFLAAIDSYQQAIAEAADRSRNAVAQKNALRQILIGMLRSLGMYVNTVCKGNLVMLVSSGLPVGKDATPTHVTEPIIESVKQAMNPGCLSVKIGSVPGAKTFLYQITTDPVTETSEWITFGSSRVQYEFTDLEQGKKYWIRVVAIGSNNQQAVSEEVPVFVLQRSMAQAA